MSYAVKIEDGVVVQVGVMELDQDCPVGWVQSDVKVGMGFSYTGGRFLPYVRDVVEEVAAQAKENIILQLKTNLRETDYVTFSDYDQERPDVLAKRKVWREEIRKLETP